MLAYVHKHLDLISHKHAIFSFVCSHQIINLRLIPRMILVKHAGELVEKCFGEFVVE